MVILMQGSLLLINFFFPSGLWIFFVRADREDMYHKPPGTPSLFKEAYIRGPNTIV